MRSFRLLAVLASVTFIPSAQAKLIPDGRTAFNQPACIDGMSKNISVSINFNGQRPSLAEARAAFDTTKKSLEAQAAKIGGDALQLSSYNYNLSMNMNYNNGSQIATYNFNGSVNYQLQNEVVAQKLSDWLAEQKQQFSMNVNANRCQNPVADR